MTFWGKNIIALFVSICLLALGVPAQAYSGTPVDGLPSGNFVRATWSTVQNYPGLDKGTFEIAFPTEVRCKRETNGSGTCQGEYYTRWISGKVFLPGFYLYTDVKATRLNITGESSNTRWHRDRFYVSISQSQNITLRGDDSFGNSFFYSSYVTSFTPVTVPFTVQTQAEVDAEQAERDRQAQLEAQAEANRIKKIMATKLTITCKSKSKTFRVTGDPPRCPSGSTAVLGKFKAFQAYSTCRLYKKTQGISTAALIDGGKTLEIGWYSAYGTGIELTSADMSCLLRIMKVPNSVIRKIDATRPIDGYIELKYPGGFIAYSIRLGGKLDATFTG